MDRIRSNINVARELSKAIHRRMADDQVTLAYLHDQIEAEHLQLVEMMSDPSRVLWQLQHQSPEFEFSEENMTMLAGVCGWDYVPTQEHARRLADNWAKQFPAGRRHTFNVDFTKLGPTPLIDGPSPKEADCIEDQEKTLADSMIVDGPEAMQTSVAEASTSAGSDASQKSTILGRRSSGRPLATALIVGKAMEGCPSPTPASVDASWRADKGKEKAAETSILDSPQELTPDSE